MAALNGTLKEWVETEPGRWEREPEDGVVFFTPSEKAQTFADYFAYRVEPEPVIPDPRDVKIAELEARLVQIELRTDKIEADVTAELAVKA